MSDKRWRGRQMRIIATTYTTSGDALLDDMLMPESIRRQIDPKKRYRIRESIRGREFLGESTE